MDHKLPPVKIRIAVVLILAAAFITWYVLKDRKWTDDIELSGTIEIREIDLSSALRARIKKINVREGQKVKKGDVLAVLDDSVVSASYSAAKTVFENAERNTDRSADLYKTNSISKQAYEKAQTAYASARAGYKEAEFMFNESRVKAPWDGTVLERHVELGELVNPNAPVFTVGDLEKAEVSIYVPLPDLGKIRPGQKAVIKTDTYENKNYEGTVVKISDKAEFTPKNVQTKDERVKQVFEVVIYAENKNGELKPGMPCDVFISAEKEKQR